MTAELSNVRLASGAQLWRLNELGLLPVAVAAGERVSAELARGMLSDAAVRGLWEPSQRKVVLVGLEAAAARERLRLDYRRRLLARREGKPCEPAMARVIERWRELGAATKSAP